MRLNAKALSSSFQTLIAVTAILVSKSLYYETFGQNILVLIVLFLVLAYVIREAILDSFKISLSSLIFYICLVLVILINPNKALSTSILLITSITTSLLFVNVIPLSKFTDVLYGIMKLLMISSLFRYFIIVLDVPSLLPVFTSIMGVNYKNYILFGVLENPGTYFNLIRNNGLWWEPGAFQVMINLSFLLGLAFKKISNKDYLLYLIVIISTFSSAGLVIFCILSFIYFRNRLNKKFLILLMIVCIPILISTAFVENVIINKFTLENASAKSRFNDLTLALQIFKDYPVLGIGAGNTEIVEDYKLVYDYGTGSNGIFYLITNFGLFSVLFLFPTLYPNYKILFQKRDRLLIYLSLVLIFFTQNFSIILIYSIMHQYGLKNNELYRLY